MNNDTSTNRTKRVISRSDVQTVWREVPIPVEQQVEYLADGTAQWTLKAPFWAQTFQGSTLNEALADLYNNHPLR